MLGESAVQLRELNAANALRWNRFVESSPDGTFFHLAEWQEVIARAFGHGTHFLYAEQGGEVTGVLPLVHVRSALFGNALSSTPFCVYGGIIAATPEAANALQQSAVQLANDLGVDYLELRNRREQPGLPAKDLYVSSSSVEIRFRNET